MKKFMSWAEYDLIVGRIFQEIKESGKEYENIGTFPRGGFIIATHLANLLDIQEIIILAKKKYIAKRNDKILIVDDISDSGETLVHFKKFDIACICYKKGTVVKPIYFSLEYKREDWVVFPWEPKESKEKRDRDEN